MRQGEGNETDDTWIVKYREAVKNAPSKKSRFHKMKQIAANCLGKISSKFSSGKKMAPKPARGRAAESAVNIKPNITPNTKKTGSGTTNVPVKPAVKRKIG